MFENTTLQSVRILETNKLLACNVNGALHQAVSHHRPNVDSYKSMQSCFRPDLYNTDDVCETRQYTAQTKNSKSLCCGKVGCGSDLPAPFLGHVSSSTTAAGEV